jgi:hypothetical protein
MSWYSKRADVGGGRVDIAGRANSKLLGILKGLGTFTPEAFAGNYLKIHLRETVN